MTFVLMTFVLMTFVLSDVCPKTTFVLKGIIQGENVGKRILYEICSSYEDDAGIFPCHIICFMFYWEGLP